MLSLQFLKERGGWLLVYSWLEIIGPGKVVFFRSSLITATLKDWAIEPATRDRWIIFKIIIMNYFYLILVVYYYFAFVSLSLHITAPYFYQAATELLPHVLHKTTKFSCSVVLVYLLLSLSCTGMFHVICCVSTETSIYLSLCCISGD